MSGNHLLKTLSIVALLISSASTVFSQGTDQMLVSGDTLQLSADLSATEHTTGVPLLTSPGAYVEGALKSDGVSLELWLMDADGAPLRRLLSNVTSERVFRFVAKDARYHLKLVAAEAGASGALTILRNLPLAEQTPQAPMVADTAPQSPILQDVLKENTPAAIEAFWNERKKLGTPMVEPDPQGDANMRLVSFLWRGADHNVRLIGAPANDHAWLAPLGETDIWFASFRVKDDLRLTYQFAPDIPGTPGTAREQRIALLATLQADPLNAHGFLPQAADPFEQKSYFALPNAPEQPGFVPDGTARQSPAPLLETSFADDTRRIWLYHSEDFDPKDPEAILLLMFDGWQYSQELSIPDQLHRLHQDGRIPPVAAVFIDSQDPEQRWRDLACSDDFLDQVALDILPQAQRHFALSPNAARTVVAGSSLGGLSSVCLAQRHPDKVGNFISMSGSFWWTPTPETGETLPYLAETTRANGPLPLRGFFSAGRFEASRGPGDLGIVETTDQVAAAMQEVGYPKITQRFYEGGHDYAIWRGAVTEGLLALFAATKPPHKE